MSKYSFRSLYDATFDLGGGEKATIKKVVIPRIQRDYAQGRKVKRGEVERLNDQGRRFIDNIFTHLDEGSPMEMDFIYGAEAPPIGWTAKAHDTLPSLLVYRYPRTRK